MVSTGNYTPADYKFVNLTCIISPYYLEKCKKSYFNDIIYMFFWLNISSIPYHVAIRQSWPKLRIIASWAWCMSVYVDYWTVVELLQQLGWDMD